MTERSNYTGRHAPRPQAALNETPRPKRKRPEKSRPEPERTRKPRPDTAETRPGTARSARSAAPERRQRPETARTRAEQPKAARQSALQEDAERARAQRRRRKRRLRRRVYRVLLGVLAVVFALSAAMVVREMLRHDALKGTWTLDESTAYVFDGKGSGTLRLRLGSYAFSYTIEDNVVTLDFADEALTDASYSFLLGRDALTLDTNTGTVYRLERESK